MFISPKSGAGGIQKLLYLKCNVLKWESRFTLGLKVAKNKHYIKKMFQVKVVE